MNIYVGNLAFGVKEEELRKLFADFGPVASIRVVTDKFSGKSKGFAFVEMETKEGGENAVAELNGKEYQGRRLVVDAARPKREDYGDRRPGGGGGGGRGRGEGRGGGGGGGRGRGGYNR